jgi:hypothetical protein
MTKCVLCDAELSKEEHREYFNKCGACAHDTDDYYNNREVTK